MLKSQVEYNKFYDNLKKYANSIASRWFSDLGLRADAVDVALDKAIDEYIGGKEVESQEASAQDIIRKSLVSSVIGRKLDLASANQDEKQLLEDVDNLRIQQILDKKKFPKVRILDLPEGKQKHICLLYWKDGLTQGEIATKLGYADSSYISKVIAKYSN